MLETSNFVHLYYLHTDVKVKCFFFFYVIEVLLVFKRQNVCIDRHFHKYSAQSPLKRAPRGLGAL